jgi:putative thioredoxin
MSNYANIIDVSEDDFEFQVVAYSQQKPVIVDFWAEWCAPCRVLGPVLEELAEEAEGAFRLAKVNVDENPKLAKRFNVFSIPTVKGFNQGQMVAEFAGALPEGKIREFLQQLVPDETSLAIEKGFSLLEERDASDAEQVFRTALHNQPGNPQALWGLSRALMFQNRNAEAADLLANFPISKMMTAAQTLLPLATALASYEPADEIPDDALEAAYQRSLMLLVRGNYPAALDGFMSILREDKRFRTGTAHQLVLGVFTLLGESHYLTLEYQRELANILF